MVSFPCEEELRQSELRQSMYDHEGEDRSSSNGIEQDNCCSCDLRTALMKRLLAEFVRSNIG